ncbi:MAG: hypothetical protein Q9216_002995 [Gyalolechia sp. 2 TL-2023]
MAYSPFSSYLCGCHYFVNHQKRYLPQVQLDAHSTILSNTSRTTLKQTFSNSTSSDIKQCTYMFPLYDGVSVVAFTCRIGSRLLRGVVKERAQAKATFDAAVSRGESAGLLEQLPEASDVFSTHLGNVPANGKVHVKITYVGELKHDAQDDGIRFTIPTRIAPRYGEVSSSQAREGSSVHEQGGISITVDASVAEGSFIKGIQSPTHPIAVTMGNTSTSGHADPAMHQASATLSLGSTVLDNDFVLIVLTKETGMPKALLERHPTLPNQRALMLTLVPKFSLPRINPEIVLVADRSGSMEPNMSTLIRALKVFLKSLPVGVKFNVCSFGSRHTFLWPKSQAYSRDSMNEALAHVETFSANYGGTEISSALTATIENRYMDIPCEVMLLTDGAIRNQGALFTDLNDKVQKSQSGLRIFALGIGDQVSHALVEGVARAGNGFAQIVNNNEKLDAKVIRMLKGGLFPHTTDYNLEVKYENTDEDFEIVDKVTDMLEVLLSDDKAGGENKENKPVSFFNETSGQDGQEKPPSAENDTTDPFAHLPTISAPKILQTPQNIPPLFPFSRTSVYLLFSEDATLKTPKSVTLRAKSEHGPLELEVPVEVLDAPGKTIHQLAARKAILELEEGRGWIYEARDSKDTETLVKHRYPSRFDEMVQREAVRIGVRYQVGGKWCSFVAIDDEEKDKDVNSTTAKYLSVSDDGDADMRFESLGSGNHVSYCPNIDVRSERVVRAALQPSNRTGGPSSRKNKNRSGFSASVATTAFTPTAPFLPGTASGFSPTSPAWPPPMAGFAATSPAYSATGSKVSPPSPAYSPNLSDFSASSPAPSPLASEDVIAEISSSRSSSIPKTANEKVHAVIALQDFEGWWERSERLLKILGMDVEGGAQTKEWITMLVVRWLEVKMVAEADVWELVVEKAKAWLEGQVMGEGEMEKLEREVMAYVR